MDASVQVQNPPTSKQSSIIISVPISLKHWNSSVTYPSPPNYVVSIHSSKPVLLDQIPMAKYSLSDALFLLVQKLGLKHEVNHLDQLATKTCVKPVLRKLASEIHLCRFW